MLGLVVAALGHGGDHGLFNAAETPLLLDVSPNARVLLFTAAISLVTGIVFGLVPAFASTRVDLTPALKDVASTRLRRAAGRCRTRSSPRRSRSSIVVLAVAALLVRTLYNLKTLDAGFARGNLLLVTLDTNGTPVPEASRLATSSTRCSSACKTLPGVQTGIAVAIDADPHLRQRARPRHAQRRSRKRSRTTRRSPTTSRPSISTRLASG